MENRSILMTPTEFSRESFLDLVSLSAGMAIARQNAFGALIAERGGWNVDIRERTITFGDKAFSIGILGSESEQSGTWLWGWANTEANIPELANAASRRAKKALGACPEFSTGKFMLDELHNGHNIAMVSVGAAEKCSCYYRCPYNGGALFVQIENLPDEIFAPLDSTSFMRQYLEIISSFYCDHRLLAAGFLYQNGTEFSENGGEIEAFFPDRTLVFSFESAEGFCRVYNVSSK